MPAPPAQHSSPRLCGADVCLFGLNLFHNVDHRHVIRARIINDRRDADRRKHHKQEN